MAGDSLRVWQMVAAGTFPDLLNTTSWPPVLSDGSGRGAWQSAFWLGDPVPDAGLGPDDLVDPRSRGRGGELAPEPVHVDVEVLAFAGIGEAPDLAQQPALGDDPPAVGEQHAKQLELAGGQRNDSD